MGAIVLVSGGNALRDVAFVLGRGA
jgi:hypothetical protein